MVDEEILESALYCCNMLNEIRRDPFWDPRGLTFDEFLARVVPKKKKFNKKYNLLEDK
jgi:hypothetical protein